MLEYSIGGLQIRKKSKTEKLFSSMRCLFVKSGSEGGDFDQWLEGNVIMVFANIATENTASHTFRNLKVDQISVGKWIGLSELPFADSGPSRVGVV